MEPGLDLPPGRPVLGLQRRLLLVEEVLESGVHGLQHGHGGRVVSVGLV